MSIRGVLLGLVEQERVSHVAPQIKGQSAKRHFFLEASLYKRLVSSTEGRSPHEQRLAMLWQDIDTFTTGNFISFGDDPYEKSNDAFMARTDPVELGIFDIRSRPFPALRLFGGFTETDTFLGLTVRSRKELGGRGEPFFSDALAEAQFVWNRLFPEHPPLFSSNPKEHVSQNAYIV